jgi:hypothetical protein
MRAFMGCAAAVLLAALGVLTVADMQAAAHPSGSLDWRTLSIEGFGTAVDYPAGIFSVDDGAAEKGTGQRLRSADGRAALTVYSRENDAAETPASYLRSNLRLTRSALDYERVTPSFFAISSVRQGVIFYSRCNFSSEMGGAIHCFDLVYPQREQRAWDPVVTRISRSLRPLEGAGM